MSNPKRMRALRQRQPNTPAVQDYIGMVNEPSHLNVITLDPGGLETAQPQVDDTGGTGSGSGPGTGTGTSNPPATSTDTCTDGPAITQVTNLMQGSARMQGFRIGPCVLDGYSYTLEVYSHPVSVSANGDTPVSIASKMAAAINATSAASWNAPASVQGQPGFPPRGTTLGDVVNVSCNGSNQFAAYASGSPATPPPPPPPPLPQGTSYIAPADNATIDGWDCPTLTSKRDEYNNVLADSSIDQPTRTAYENALLEVNSRYSTICVPLPPHPIENPTGEPVPPTPSPTDVAGMDCSQLQALLVSLTTNAVLYRNSPSNLQLYQQTLDSVNSAIASKCAVSTPIPSATSPTPTPAPAAPQVNILPGNAAAMGGGGGGSSDQSQSPTASIKRYWWIGLIAVGVAFILYKPGMKPGQVK